MSDSKCCLIHHKKVILSGERFSRFYPRDPMTVRYMQQPNQLSTLRETEKEYMPQHGDGVQQ